MSVSMSAITRSLVPLRVARERACLTQAELAERAGIHAMTVHRIEREREVPRPSTKRRLATVLGVPAAIIAWPQDTGTSAAAKDQGEAIA